MTISRQKRFMVLSRVYNNSILYYYYILLVLWYQWSAKFSILQNFSRAINIGKFLPSKHLKGENMKN